jgi:hypothetical protein
MSTPGPILGNQYFHSIQNVASADVQRIKVDTLQTSNLSVPLKASPSGTAGVAGDVVFTAAKLWVCTVSGAAGIAVWVGVALA